VAPRKPFRRRLLVVFLTFALGAVAFVLLSIQPRQRMSYEDRTGQPRTPVFAVHHAAVAGTPWATRAAMEVLAGGGNACDAAVAALLALNVTHGEAAGFPGVAPMLHYDAASGRVRSYVGAGTAPAAATPERFRDAGFSTVPVHDIRAQLLPASPDVLVALLRDCGSRSFGELAAAAVELAREGFPAHAVLVRNLDLPFWRRLGFALRMPYNAEVFLQGGWWRPLRLHERLRFPDLADTLEELAAAESRALAAGGSRDGGLEAVRACFYRGPIADAIAAFHRREGGWITEDDLAGYRGNWEEPLRGSWQGYEVHTNGTWSQGIVVPMALQILEGLDLAALRHNSPRYVHTVAQALELAIADRDAYVADDRFVDVPVDRLLSKDFAAERRAARTDRAFGPPPPPGDAGVRPGSAIASASSAAAPKLGGLVGQDTSQLAVVDRAGNAVVMTPSDFPATPMVPGTGLTLGNRMTQFRLDPDSVAVLAPGKRPRITPHAVVVTRGGRLHLAFSTPGADMQAQALVQVFLGVHVFGMSLQDAIEAPRFFSVSAPSSFAPHASRPGTLRLEADLFAAAGDGLRDLGYKLIEDPAWDKDFGAVGALLVGDDGRIAAGADPREETWAEGR
jgi:gamma-glutamyltranspeptidase/glutathione hydrolase